MRRLQLDALVAVSPVNVLSLSGYTCWVDSLMREYMVVPGGSDHLVAETFALLTVDGHSALVVNCLFAVNASQLDVNELHVFGRTAREFDHSGGGAVPAEYLVRVFEGLRGPAGAVSAVGALLDSVRALGLEGGRIGIELSAMTCSARAEIVAALPRTQLLECATLLRLIRSVKSELELQRLTRSAEINELVATECLALALPGVSTLDLAGHYGRRVAELGATIDHFAFGVAGLGIATEVAHSLRATETLYVDFGCVYAGCYSDSGRTLSVGIADEGLASILTALHTGIQEGAAALRPGVRSSSVQGTMRRALDELGISRSNPHGHGLGLEIRELPLIVADTGRRMTDDCVDLAADLEIEEGMVVNLESALFLPATASLHVEMSLVVTRVGCRPLVPQSRSEPFVSEAPLYS